MFSFVASMLIASTISTATAAGLPREPTEKWLVDFADAQCIASRNYGTADDPLVLAIKAPALGDVIELAVVRPGEGGRYAEQLEGHFAFDDGKPLRTTMLVFATGEPKHRIVRFVVPLDQFAAARTASVIRIRAKGEFDERFVISQLDPLMKVIDVCVDDLRKVWNVVEGDAQSPLAQDATGEVLGLIQGDDYPDAALENDQQGKTKFALLIDEQGRVADCTIIETSGVAALDGQSCAIIRERAKFEPAVGPDGKPAKDAYLQSVSWKIR